jgi:trimethylamine--corrinoid protein Co-methyltransferase
MSEREGRQHARTEGRGRGGRSEMRARRSVAHGLGRPWSRLENRYPRYEILSADQLEAIHEASLTLLETQGLEVLCDEALATYRAAGAEVDEATRMVRLDRALVMPLVGQAPDRFNVTPRNRDHRVEVGGNSIVFGGVSGPPNVSDTDRGRRPGTYEDQCNLIKLLGALNCIHSVSSAPVEAQDLPAETRHLDACYANIRYTDKVFLARGIGRQRIVDTIAMAAIARGQTVDQLDGDPAIMTVINVNSPRRVDVEMIAGLTEMVRCGQAPIVTPFTLMGAMTPVTMAGALAQQNAEALAVIAYTQILRPGAPVVYGGFTSNVDMKSGAPAFGTPEYAQAVIAGGQLARRYKLPYRSSNVNAANVVDAQAAYETQNALWSCIIGGANFVHHAGGWMEGGLVASYEKMILDAELLQQFAAFLTPIEVSDQTLALDAIREVGPGGHFFGVGHTLERYETAFYEPILSDWRNYESWREAGAETATQRANAAWKRILAEYEPPAIDPGVDEALRDYMVRRKRAVLGKDAA